MIKLQWRKASYSDANGACVELAPTSDGTAMRDSKLGEASPVLRFSPGRMTAFIEGIKAGEFDDLLNP